MAAATAAPSALRVPGTVRNMMRILKIPRSGYAIPYPRESWLSSPQTDDVLAWGDLINGCGDKVRVDVQPSFPVVDHRLKGGDREEAQTTLVPSPEHGWDVEGTVYLHVAIAAVGESEPVDVSVEPLGMHRVYGYNEKDATFTLMHYSASKTIARLIGFVLARLPPDHFKKVETYCAHAARLARAEDDLP